MTQNSLRSLLAKDELGDSGLLRALIDDLPDQVYVKDTEGCYLLNNVAHVRALGAGSPEEVTGKSDFDFYPKELAERYRADEEEIVRSGKPLVCREEPSVDEEGNRSWHVTMKIPLRDGSGKIVGLAGMTRDITERKEAEEALKESELRLRTVIANVPVILFALDDEGVITLLQARGLEPLGLEPNEMVGRSVFDLYRDRPEFLEYARRALAGEPVTTTVEMGGRVYEVRSSSLREEEDGEVSGVIGVALDITERKELEEQLEHRAFHDSLTELPNRALFLDRLRQALARTSREGGPVAVLLLDLNHFKVINDSLGHDAGNAVLVEVAKRLRGSVRPGDTVGRIFGDEFAVLLEAPSGVQEAKRVAERIQEGLQAPFNVEGQEVFVSPSIGIALGETHEDQPEEALRHADLAMYAAKRRGRVQYEVYEPSMDQRAMRRMGLENELRRAVGRKEFEVHYQPIIELGTGEIGGVEALVRWRHLERGLVEAEEFVQIIEETGLIRPIGRRVLEEACRQAKEWRERYLDKAPRMCVNFSTSQFGHDFDLIPKILNDTGLEPGALQLEITERAVMDDAEFSIGKLKKLKELGVEFAIDDYGMGYSCLYYLKRMPVDSLKIDRTFITGLGEDPGDEAIVSGTIGLAHALGLKVVAEGVETEEQLEKLKELGCDLAQGYHFAEPLPGEEAVEKLLQEGISW